ncbi:hypothetical protein Z946_233 [Sulfitobacter noctilucicola]|uniref:Uncharacterized protein n=1 Tax=Sulfitobacter noctilucicola TaxID=1342301 RepID=A0A7W6MB22_9RHOB|nr:hypothetical protein Z946_233 [Sulfitobacter noctilucicola]MBB4175576.1 hypothetical protein [Sulfitobacter noctilucicola]
MDDTTEKTLAEEAAQNLGMEIDDVQSVMNVNRAGFAGG